MGETFKIRVVSPWLERLRVGDALLSRDVAFEEADALLCDWSPCEELFTFHGRKAWYNCEPRRHFEALERRTWPGIRQRLKPEEFLNHAHSAPRFRVPHITHNGPLTMDHNHNRSPRAVAVVSGYGGSPRKRYPDIRFRNRCILNPSVDLYGRSKGWCRYKSRILSRPRLPANFKGDIPGDWDAEEKMQLLARYKVCVCLENSHEPYYFTEKFVDAVQAGCIPVYRAHPTVRDTFLAGANWVDPCAFGMRVTDTLQAALNKDLPACQEANERWLRTNQFLAQTSVNSVYARIVECLQRKA